MTCVKCAREIPDGACFCCWCGVRQTPRKVRGKRGNGQGSAFRRGRTWTARVTVGSETVIKGGVPAVRLIRATKGGFQTKREALAYCPQLIEESRGRHRAAKQKLSMRQVYELWAPAHELRVSKSTMDCYRAAWRWFAPLYDAPFCDIDLDDLQECVDDCPRGKRTKENMKALAGLLMKWGMPRHQTDMNYAEFLHTGDGEKGTHPAFSAEQVERIRAQIGASAQADAVYCLIYTGFRPTELFSLTRDDLRDGVLYGGIKTEAGKGRAVPVSPRIAEYIDARASGDSPWLFPRDDGSQMSARYFRDVYFYPVLAAAGIQPLPTSDKPAVYVPYSCRHTFANLLKGAPGSDRDKAGLIGHEDYTTTKRMYQSAELDALRTIIEAL